MASAHFTVHPGLSDFLPRERRGGSFACDCARAATLKNAIEAIGIPHTEVAAVRVNDAAATLDRIVREGDRLELFAWSDIGAPQRSATLEFVADAHLGGLARYLRMLGFDTVHDNEIADETIRRLAGEERRIVLTRDRELLKCRDILIGAYVRAIKPEAQLREIAERFGLAAYARPFSRCLRCNLALMRVTKKSVIAELPCAVARQQALFFRCSGCQRIYWPGSHYHRMQSALARLLEHSLPGDAAER